jgi:tryptophanase
MTRVAENAYFIQQKENGYSHNINKRTLSKKFARIPMALP